MTVEIIRKIEREISSFAPDHFPNKLDSKGFPEDSITKLERKTQEIENRIAAAIDSERAAYFAKARIFAAESSKVQTDFVEAVLREIPKRYYDPGPAIQEMLHRHKLEFLTTIARELGV